jgi:putative redox protein
MSLTARSRSIPGTLRQEIVIDGKHRLITDEPECIGGEGSAPSPHELLPAALAACISTTLVIYTRQKDWKLDQVTVDIDYDHHATPRTADVAIHLTGDLTPEQLYRLQKVAAACPVHRSLGLGVQVSSQLTAQEYSDPVCDGQAHKARSQPTLPHPTLNEVTFGAHCRGAAARASRAISQNAGPKRLLTRNGSRSRSRSAASAIVSGAFRHGRRQASSSS